MNVFDLQALATRIREVKKHGDSWPFLVCGDVLALSDHWHDPALRSTVGKRSINAWLRDECSCGTWGLARFRKMQAIVDRLGPSMRREGWDWRAAQWVHNNLPKTELDAVLALYPSWVKQSKSCLTEHQIKARVSEMREVMKKAA